MVNKKVKIEKPSRIREAVLTESESRQPEGMFLHDFTTFSEPDVCKKRQRLSQCEESLSYHGTALDYDDHLSNSPLSHDFGDSYERLELNGADSLNESAVHLAARHSQCDRLEQLLRDGAPVDASDLGGRTALHLATRYKNVRAVKLLLTHGANPRARTHDGLSPLFFAVQSGSTVLVEILVNEGCDVNEPVLDADLNRCYSYLHIAVERNHVMMVETLLQCKADVNIRDCYGSTSLHLACRDGRSEITELLLYHGARVHDRDNNELTPLYLAVDAGHKDIFQLLLLHGANLNDRGTAGASLLHLAIKHGDLDFITELLSKGADVDAATRFGKTPLHYAVAEKNWPALQLLLAHGADANRREILGKTALHAAIESRRNEAYELLLLHGADVNARDNARQTPLHSAVRQGCVNIVRMLLQRGANVNAADEFGQTALHLAVKFGYVHLLEILTRHRANVDALDNEGQTPLHLAVTTEYSKLLYLLPDFTFFAGLLRYGADVRCKNLIGETALHVAVARRCGPFARQLLQYGSEVDAVTHDGRTSLRLAVTNVDIECVEHLLTFGADANSLETEISIDVSVKRILVRHFIRRSVAGLRISAKESNMIESNDDAEYKEHCVKEVKRMSVTRMYNQVTYCDFLRGSRRCLATFVESREVAAIFEQHLHRSTFPIYADMLERNFAIGKRYEPFFEAANRRLHALCRYQLPLLPLDKVLGYLNDRDMKTLVEAIPTLPIVFETEKGNATR